VCFTWFFYVSGHFQGPLVQDGSLTSAFAPGFSTRENRRAPFPADEPPPASLVQLVEAYREKFKGSQPTGEDCRKDTSYVYVHWYVRMKASSVRNERTRPTSHARASSRYMVAGTGNRLPSTITGLAIALITGRRLILPTISKQFFAPSIPVCYHDPGFGGTSATGDVAPMDFPEAGSKWLT
jgi:hypothetical protein